MTAARVQRCPRVCTTVRALLLLASLELLHRLLRLYLPALPPPSASDMENKSPTVYAAAADAAADDLEVCDEPAGADGAEPIDAAEVYALLRHLNDPEHP